MSNSPDLPPLPPASTDNLEPPVPPPADRDAQRLALAKLRRELVTFFCGFGAILLVPGVWLLANPPSGAPPLWGLPRHLAIGVPVVAIALWFIASGMAVRVWRKPLVAVSGIAAALALTGFYFIMMSAASHVEPFNVMSMVMVLIPVLVGSRVQRYLKQAAA